MPIDFTNNKDIDITNTLSREVSQIFLIDLYLMAKIISTTMLTIKPFFLQKAQSKSIDISNIRFNLFFLKSSK